MSKRVVVLAAVVSVVVVAAVIGLVGRGAGPGGQARSDSAAIEDEMRRGGHGTGGGAKRSAVPLDPAPDCSVTVSGAVQASFRCKSDVRPDDGKGLRLAFTPQDLPKDVGAFLCGPLKVPAPAKVGSYSAAQLASGRVLLGGPDHVSFFAEAGKQPRGTVTVELTSLELGPHEAKANGTVTARLVPDGKSRGDVLVTVKF